MAEDEAPEDRIILRRLARMQATLASGVRSRVYLRWGPTGTAIVDAARQEGADLVVVPRDPGHSLAHPLHDAAYRHVVRNSDVPVLVVPPQQPRRTAA
jgi:nucleotide-binding universal stress UspA family protein